MIFVSMYEIPRVNEKKPLPEDFGLTHEKIQNMYEQNLKQRKKFNAIFIISFIPLFLLIMYIFDLNHSNGFGLFFIVYSFFYFAIYAKILYTMFPPELTIDNEGLVIVCSYPAEGIKGDYAALTHYNSAICDYNKRKDWVDILRKMTKTDFWINEQFEMNLRDNLHNLFFSNNYHLSDGPYFYSFIAERDKKNICVIYGLELKFSKRYAARAKICEKDNIDIWLISINGYDDKLINVANKYNMKMLSVSDLVEMAKQYIKNN